MKTLYSLSFFLLAALALCVQSCSKKDTADATQPLKESFKSGGPEVQQAVVQVNTHLKAGEYAEATRVLVPLVSGSPMTAEQKQAVGIALKQINQSLAANPKLDTKEMYELRSKLYQAVQSGPRF